MSRSTLYLATGGQQTGNNFVDSITSNMLHNNGQYSDKSRKSRSRWKLAIDGNNAKLSGREFQVLLTRCGESGHLRADVMHPTEWRKKRGHRLIANILKFHDRIAWKLVNFRNIIC